MVKKVTLIVLLTLAILGYFFLDNYDPHSEKVFKPLETAPISFNDDGSLHFFQSGFAVTDKGESLFFDYAGNPIEIPIEDKDGSHRNGASIVTDSTNSYMMIDNRFLYDTTKLPFEPILESPQEGAWDIREFDNTLLLIAKAGDNKLDPYIMQKTDNSLHKIDGLGGLAYIDSDFLSNSDSFSIITLDKDSPSPSSKILHFADINVPYGILSTEEEIFYRICKYDDFFIVMGLHSVKCYDMIGELKWEKNIPNLFDYQPLTINKDLALYFNNRYIEGKNNTMIVTNEGTYDFISIDRGIHYITKYKSHYIGVKDKNTLVFVNSRGVVAEEYELDRDIYGVYWTPFAPDIIFLNTGAEISIYSITPQTERSKSL